MNKAKRDALLRGSGELSRYQLIELFEQIDQAEMAIDALKDDLEETLPYAPDYFREKWGLGESLIHAECYLAKHGGGA